jgi:hypothetical protein
MSESALGSSLLMAGVAAVAWLLARWLCDIASGKVVVGLAAVCVVGAGASILAVDVNIPLASSHLRPSGELAPLWISLAAWLFRVLPLFIPLVLSVRRRAKSRRSEGAHG